MKSEFLKGLGITEQSTIDAIMAENGKDVNAAKSKTTELETKVSELEGQISERDKQLNDLKNSAKDNETLTKKITELEEANTASKTAYENKIADIQKNHAVESGIRDAKAKNVKAVMALIDMEKISYKEGKLEGLSEQIETLTKGEDTSFLFGESKPGAPSGAQPGMSNNLGGGGNNPPTQMSLADAFAKSMKK